jgi:membrane protein implicated in regulation of membrane protease activity
MLIYGICLIVGGTFVLLSAIGGLDGTDFDGDLHGDFHLDFHIGGNLDDIDVGTHQGQTGTPIPTRRLWLPLFSLRFWTFTLCFFGLTGVLLTLVQPSMASWLVALLSVFMGILCGTTAAFALRILGSNQVNSLIHPEQLAGQIGTVEIPFDSHSRGKVSLRIGGSTVGFFALTEEERAFQVGDPVLVVGLDSNKLWVVSTDMLSTQYIDGGQ